MRCSALRCEMAEGRRDGTGDAALHIHGAAAIEDPVADHGGERRICPGVEIARWNDVGVARETKMRLGLADARIQVFDVRRARLRERHAVAGEARSGEHGFEQRQGAAFVGRHALAAHERLREGYGVFCVQRHGVPSGALGASASFAGRVGMRC